MHYDPDRMIAEYGITVKTTGYKVHQVTFPDGESFSIEGTDAEGAKIHSANMWEDKLIEISREK